MQQNTALSAETTALDSEVPESVKVWMRRLNRTSSTIFLLAAAAVVAWRAWIAHRVNGASGTFLSNAGQALRNDALVFAVVGLFCWISYSPRTNRAIGVCLRALVVCAGVVYATDQVVVWYFATHLLWQDAIRHIATGPQFVVYIMAAKPLVMRVALTLTTIGLCAGMCRFAASRHRIRNRAGHARWAVIVLLLIGLYWSRPPTTPTTRSLLMNVFDYNRTVSDSLTPYTPEFIASIDRREEIHRMETAPRTPDVIVLVWESLSCYQSEFFGGDRNWTPHFDRIAREHRALCSFYANGFCSEDGAIAMLTGNLPFAPPREKPAENIYVRAFDGFHQSPDSLPRVLNRRGYQTEFLTGGDLGFAGQGTWMRNLGFDHVEGSESPAYEGIPRGFIESPADGYLFDRVLERVEASTAPYFAFVTTSTTHPPYQSPTSGLESPQECFEYTDREVGRFVRALTESGYFENGLLLITSDHRAMAPIMQVELETRSVSRAAHWIPLVCVGLGTQPERVDASYQQTDVFQTLCNLVSAEARTSDWRGDFLSGIPARYVGCRQRGRRDIAGVFCDGFDVLVKLHGDQTRAVTGLDCPRRDRLEIVRKLNAIRTRESRRKAAASASDY